MWMNARKKTEKYGRCRIFCGCVTVWTEPNVAHCVVDANLGDALRCIVDADDLLTPSGGPPKVSNQVVGEVLEWIKMALRNTQLNISIVE